MAKKYKYEKFFTFDGHRYVVRGDTMEEIYTKKANKLRDLEEGRFKITGSMTVERWIDICYETYKPNMAESTKADSLSRIKKHIVPAIGKMPIKNITPIQCQMILSAQAGMSKSHVVKLKQELNFIFSKAVKNHLIHENPADDLVLPKYKEGERRSITDEERKHLLIVADKYEPFLLFLLMLYCGCRPGEAIHCMGSDIMTTDRSPLLHIRGTKTINSDRVVPIPQKLYERIRSTKKDSPIATNTKNKMHNESSYNRLCSRLRREMNISMGATIYRNRLVPPLPLADDFVPYDLRHTYCTDLQKAGVDVRVAQKLMGHASIDITANIYTHIDQSEILSAGDLINKKVDI